MLASEIISASRTLLVDESGVRWPDDEMRRYITHGQRVIVCLKPEANPVREIVQLRGGSRQSIPATGVRLLDVRRNMSAAGAPGRVIVRTTREAIESSIVLWESTGASDTVEKFVHDPKTEPKVFYAYPPVKGVEGALATARAEVIYAGLPVAVTANGQTLTLGDEYGPALIDYVMWRCLIKDSEGGNAPRASSHLNAFAMSLAVSPKVAADVAAAQAQGGA